jgi:hypothetical protein
MGSCCNEIFSSAVFFLTERRDLCALERICCISKRNDWYQGTAAEPPDMLVLPSLNKPMAAAARLKRRAALSVNCRLNANREVKGQLCLNMLGWNEHIAISGPIEGTNLWSIRSLCGILIYYDSSHRVVSLRIWDLTCQY